MGYVCVLVAALLWSTNAFFAKAPIFDVWPLESRGLHLAFWRAVFAAAALGLFVRKIEWKWAMLPMVVFFCLMNWLYLSAMVRVEGSIAIWLQSTAPGWVFLASIVIHSEKITPADWRMLSWAAAGVILILAFQAFQSPSIGLVFALLSGMMYAAVVLSLRHLRGCDAVWLVFLNHAVTAIVFLPLVLGGGVFPSGNQWLYLACFGALQMALPYVIFARGLRHIPGHEASLIGLIEPIMLPVWVFLAWRNAADYAPPHWSTIAGGGLILIGLVQRYGGRRKFETPNPKFETNSNEEMSE